MTSTGTLLYRLWPFRPEHLACGHPGRRVLAQRGHLTACCGGRRCAGVPSADAGFTSIADSSLSQPVADQQPQRSVPACRRLRAYKPLNPVQLVLVRRCRSTTSSATPTYTPWSRSSGTRAVRRARVIDLPSKSAGGRQRRVAEGICRVREPRDTQRAVLRAPQRRSRSRPNAR